MFGRFGAGQSPVSVGGMMGAGGFGGGLPGGGMAPRFQGAPPMARPLGSFDKLKGKKKIKKSGVYKLKKGEAVVGKKKKE